MSHFQKINIQKPNLNNSYNVLLQTMSQDTHWMFFMSNKIKNIFYIVMGFFFFFTL